MHKSLKNLKLEFFYWRKCIFEYHKFWKYIYNKYILAPKILKHKSVLEKPINNSDLSIHILTCHKDFIMSLWSLASFYQVSEIIGRLYIHNDGSLREKEKDIFKKFFPSCKIIEQKDIEKKYNKFEGYPQIKKVRMEKGDHPFVKKIVDSYFLSGKKFHLLFDTDIIWFKNPGIIFNEINQDLSKSFMMDASHTNCSVIFNDGSKLEKKLASLNAGIIFYKKENFNLKKLDQYFSNLDLSIDKNFILLNRLDMHTV